MKKNLKMLVILLLIIFTNYSFSKESQENLDMLLNQKIISKEEYAILSNKNELDEEQLYTLKVNGSVRNYIYEVEYKDGKYYFSLKEFLESIKFTNYSWGKDKIVLKLGNSLNQVTLNLKDKKALIAEDDKEINIENKFFIKNEDLYLNVDIFKNIFLESININKETQIINMILSFYEPKDIALIVNNKEDKLKDKKNIILYKNKRELFELGYARLRLEKSYSKYENENKFQSDWIGNFEYQGPLLYGDFTGNYNFKDNQIETLNLKYPDLIGGHTLEGTNSLAGEYHRKTSVRFGKDKNYYQEGKNFIIKENVPLGSRVELIYMGTVIQLKDEKNGEVIFNSDEIRGDKTYTLKIYSSDGRIEEKQIKTTEDYNLQNKNEIEYDFYLDENLESKGYDLKSNVYYGVTDYFTLGMGYDRKYENIGDDYKILNIGRIESIYNNTYKTLNYTFKLLGEKTFSDIKERGKNYNQRYKYNFLNQTNFYNFKVISEYVNYGNFYDEKKEFNEEITYDLTSDLELNYSYKRLYKKIGVESSAKYGVNYSKSFKNFLNTFELKKDKDNKMEDEYLMRTYYNGFSNYTLSLENKWSESGKIYEVSFNAYNNGIGILNYSLSAAYSQAYKEKITFNFSINYDNWFKFESNVNKNGEQSYKAGIDRIIDLKDVTYPLKDMEVSRVSITTFVDSNDNNKFDSGEKTVEGVEVEIGNKKIITNSKGKGLFLGVSNGIDHNLNIRIKKPSYSLDKNIIIVRGNASSTIYAYIPIKALTTLSGVVKFDKNYNLSKEEKLEVFDDMLIYIKDLNGNIIEITTPDNNGEFDVSGLFNKEYIVELIYSGNKIFLPNFKEKVALAYYEVDDNKNKWVFKLGKEKIVLQETNRYGKN